MNKKEFGLKGRIFTNTLRKQNELFKVNVQLRKDYLRLRWKWTETVGKEDILILLSTKPINNESQRLELYQANQWRIKLKEKTADYLEN